MVVSNTMNTVPCLMRQQKCSSTCRSPQRTVEIYHAACRQQFLLCMTKLFYAPVGLGFVSSHRDFEHSKTWSAHSMEKFDGFLHAPLAFEIDTIVSMLLWQESMKEERSEADISCRTKCGM